MTMTKWEFPENILIAREEIRILHRLEGAEYLRGHILKQEIEVKSFKEIHRSYINL